MVGLGAGARALGRQAGRRGRWSAWAWAQADARALRRGARGAHGKQAGAHGARVAGRLGHAGRMQ